MEHLNDWFQAELFGQGESGSMPPVLTVIGSGGKTSFIWHLARHVSGGLSKRILVTPTTKMLVPPSAAGFYDHYCNGSPCETKSGITLADIFNEKAGKLESLPLEMLEHIVPEYDLVLIEGDGSRGLPFKAWVDAEPVVPLFTTITVGIIPLRHLGMPVSESTVHRLPLFSLLSGAQEGERIKLEHLVRVITGTPYVKGLFAAAHGRKILFLNQVEDSKTLEQAQELLSLLSKDVRADLGAGIAGSVQQNIITCFYRKTGAYLS